MPACLPPPPRTGTPGGTLVGYYLDERRSWGLSIEELRRSLKEARDEGKLVRGLVFINPGNPTGEPLSLSLQTAVQRSMLELGGGDCWLSLL